MPRNLSLAHPPQPSAFFAIPIDNFRHASTVTDSVGKRLNSTACVSGTTVGQMGTAAEKTILVVDDSAEDVEILLRSFKAVGVQNPIQVVNNGEDAICYLAGEGRFSDRSKFPMPSVVLLDIKLPGTTGFDVLRWARSKAQLRDLVIIVLTTSELLADIKLAYELGTNSFLTKPFATAELNELIKSFHHYWIVSNRTPAEG